MIRSRSRKWLMIAAVTSGFIFIFSSLAFSDWNKNTSENTLVCTHDSDKNFHKVIPDGNGGFYVVWDDCRNCGDTNKDTYAQHFDADGNAQWGANGKKLTDNSDDSQKKAGAIPDGQGGLIVVWNNYSQSRMGAQRINSDGKLLWPTGLDVAAGSDSSRSIPDGTGGVIMADEDGCQRINANGKPLWGADPNDPDGGLVYSNDTYCVPRLTTDGARGAIISWVSSAGDSISVNRVSASGTLLWGDADNGVALATAGNYRCTRIIYDTAGGAILLWIDANNNNNIYAQRVDDSGAILWTAGGVLVTDNSTDGHFLVTDGKGGGWITWENTTDSNLYAQRISSSGDLLAAPVQLTTSGDVSAIAGKGMGGTAAVPGGGFVTTWLNDAGKIMVQRVSADGDVMWGADGVLVSDMASSIECARIAAGEYGNALIVFHDSSNNNDLYVQHINSLGKAAAEPDHSTGTPTTSSGGSSSGPCFISSLFE